MCFPFSVMKVTGKSMEPALHENDYVFVNKLAYLFSAPKKDDIVIVKHPVTGKPLIKRITNIKADKYFVKGDHAKQSTDSRNFGVLPQSQIVGKVWRIIKKK